MTKKLGEILIDLGKISEAQLQKALKAQLIFGGHLGTSLIELGYIDESILGTALSTSFNVPFATEKVLEGVPYAVTRAIPAKLVEKYKVVPIKLDGKTLQLAMLDPKNLMALDEISFVTGYRIEPWVSPEIRIFQVLEKYYNIPRSQRYITLARELNKRSGKGESRKAAPTPASNGGDPDAGVETEPVKEIAPEARSGSNPGRVAPDHWEKYGYGKSWREYADEMERHPGAPEAVKGAKVTVAAPGKPKAPVIVSPAEGGTPEEQLAAAAKRLQACTSPDEVSEVVLSFAARHLKRAAFFIVRGEHAIGWGGSGEGFFTTRIKGLNIPMVRDSLFSLIDDGRDHFLGAIPAFPSIRKFYQDLSVPMPRIGFIVPIRIREKTASILYGDGGAEDDLGSLDTALLERLASKASLALQMIIFRSKIISG